MISKRKLGTKTRLSLQGVLAAQTNLKAPNKIQHVVYIIKGETDRQPRLDAWDKCSGLVHWEDPEELDGERGGRGYRDGEHM